MAHIKNAVCHWKANKSNNRVSDWISGHLHFTKVNNMGDSLKRDIRI